MSNTETQSSTGGWKFIRQILIIIAAFQIFMILTYHYDLTKFIYVPINIATGIGIANETIASNDDTRNSVGENKVDIHGEDSVLGHTWSGHHSSNDTAKIVPNSIAMGLALISSKSKYGNKQEMQTTFPFFNKLLPSFCRTASNGYSYNFFLAFDVNDKCFTNNNNLVLLKQIFEEFTSKHCPSNSSYLIHFVQCSHSGQPARAQNDAMMEAYMSNMEHYYRVNDDTHMVTTGWTEDFITTLKGYKPPNVGVVGPNHRGGNTAILTYDFVHHNHITIFGCHYPRLFTDWWADNWITQVYKPDRSTKRTKIQILHTMILGTRYIVHPAVGKKIGGCVEHSKKTLLRYISAVNTPNTKPTGDKVISMSLSGKNPRYTFGAIRNAQLLPVFFPEWKLRIYVPSAKHKESVPIRVLNKLQLLGVELIIVSSQIDQINSNFWKYLVMFDKTVKYFLVRNTDSRLNEKDKLLTKEWIKEGSPCLGIKDMKNHTNATLVDGLIGGHNPVFQNNIGLTIEEFVARTKNLENVQDFLKKSLWSKLKDNTVYYDTVSGAPSKRMLKIDMANVKEFQMGESFDEFNQNIDKSRLEIC